MSIGLKGKSLFYRPSAKDTAELRSNAGSGGLSCWICKGWVTRRSQNRRFGVQKAAAVGSLPTWATRRGERGRVGGSEAKGRKAGAGLSLCHHPSIQHGKPQRKRRFPKPATVRGAASCAAVTPRGSRCRTFPGKAAMQSWILARSTRLTHAQPWKRWRGSSGLLCISPFCASLVQMLLLCLHKGFPNPPDQRE